MFLPLNCCYWDMESPACPPLPAHPPAFPASLQLRDLPFVPHPGILTNCSTASLPCLQLRELLLDPDWLRRKLVAAGTTAVVADFRRWVEWVGAWSGRAGGWVGEWASPAFSSPALLPVSPAQPASGRHLPAPQTRLCASRFATLEP